MDKETELSARQKQLSEPLMEGGDPLPDRADSDAEPSLEELDALAN